MLLCAPNLLASETMASMLLNKQYIDDILLQAMFVSVLRM